MRRVTSLPVTAVGRLAVAALVLAPVGLAGPATTATDQEVVEIRGQRMSVWPAQDLRERGFDVPDLPREENAAWVYLEAWNSFSDLPEDLIDAFDYAIGKAWPEDQPELRKWLTGKENREAIELARRAVRMEHCQMPYFGDPSGSVMSVLLPSLSTHRTLAKIVVADGRRLVAQKDYRGAMENFTTAMRMGHHVAQGVTLIESLVGVACWNLGNQSLREMVLRCDIPTGELAAIFEDWKQLEPLMPTVQRGIEHERLFGTTIADEVFAVPSHFLVNFQGIQSSGGIAAVKPHDGWDRLETRLGKVFLPDRTVKRHMTAYYDALIEQARLPYHDERVRDFNEEKLIMQIPQWDVISRTLMPSLSRARLLGVLCRSQTQATTIALALRLEARANQGRHPTALADLRERLTADDLVDPFSGGTFVYARTADGWAFYSVGPDRTDDGGKSGERWDTPNSDLVYRCPPEPIEPFAGAAN